MGSIGDIGLENAEVRVDHVGTPELQHFDNLRNAVGALQDPENKIESGQALVKDLEQRRDGRTCSDEEIRQEVEHHVRHHLLRKRAFAVGCLLGLAATNYRALRAHCFVPLALDLIASFHLEDIGSAFHRHRNKMPDGTRLTKRRFQPRQPNHEGPPPARNCLPPATLLGQVMRAVLLAMREEACDLAALPGETQLLDYSEPGRYLLETLIDTAGAAPVAVVERLHIPLIYQIEHAGPDSDQPDDGEAPTEEPTPAEEYLRRLYWVMVFEVLETWGRRKTTIRTLDGLHDRANWLLGRGSPGMRPFSVLDRLGLHEGELCERLVARWREVRGLWSGFGGVAFWGMSGF